MLASGTLPNTAAIPGRLDRRSAKHQAGREHAGVDLSANELERMMAYLGP
jgi:hypothetical protein